jgi:predicted nucleotidyltransferase
MKPMHLALTPAQRGIVTQLLRTLAPQHHAMAFGSRVRHDSETASLKPHADLDIALSGPPLELHQMFVLRDALSESDLPFRVDVSMLDDLPPQWRDSVAWVDLCSPVS